MNKRRWLYLAAFVVVVLLAAALYIKKNAKKYSGLAFETYLRYNAWKNMRAPEKAPERLGITWHRNVRSTPGAGKYHKLDIYRPKGDGPLPAVFYVHGGAFSLCSKETHWGMGKTFGSKGYVTFNINYRLAPRHPFPAAIEDVCAAWLWVLEHAEEYGVDPDRIAVSGESAGANLVTALTLAACTRREEPWAAAVGNAAHVPVATLPACGVFQVSDPGRFTRAEKPSEQFALDIIYGMAYTYLSPDPSVHGKTLDLADPVVALERGPTLIRPLPPFHLAVGGNDPLDVDQRRLEAALKKLKVTCEALYEPRKGHAYHVFGTEAAGRYWTSAFEFLSRHAGP